MTEPDILFKLREVLSSGIKNEPDALYLMVEVRKLLEQKRAKKTYEYLTFHCDWAVHSSLQGATAQKILGFFDSANLHLKNGLELHGLPLVLRTEVEKSQR